MLFRSTFGTNVDDYIAFDIYKMWGTTWGNTYVQTGVTAETFVGSGNIDIAQVQLCSGDVALPFQPKSFEEELRQCQRYAFDVTSGSATANIALFPVVASSTTAAGGVIQLPVQMRTAPTLETLTVGNFSLGYPGAIVLTAFAISVNNTRSVIMSCTVAAGLTLEIGRAHV